MPWLQHLGKQAADHLLAVSLTALLGYFTWLCVSFCLFVCLFDFCHGCGTVTFVITFHLCGTIVMKDTFGNKILLLIIQ